MITKNFWLILEFCGFGWFVFLFLHWMFQIHPDLISNLYILYILFKFFIINLHLYFFFIKQSNFVSINKFVRVFIFILMISCFGNNNLFKLYFLNQSLRKVSDFLPEKKMRASVVHRFGDIKNIKLEKNWPIPEIDNNQVSFFLQF